MRASYLSRFILLSCACAPAAHAYACSTDDFDSERAALAARLARLQSFAVEYVQHEETLFIEETAGTTIGGRSLHADDATREKACRLVVRDRVMRHEKRITEPYLDLVRNGEIGEMAEEIRLYTPERMEVLLCEPDDRGCFGNIQDRRPLPFRATMDWAIGVRLAFADPGWIEPSLIAEGSIERDEEGHIVLEAARANGTIDRWQFDPERGFALTRYAMQHKGRDFESLVITNSDFSNVDGILLPRAIDMVRYRAIEGEVHAVHRTKVNVKSYEVGPNAGGEDALTIDWPPTTRVFNQMDGVAYEADINGELQPIQSRRDPDRSSQSQSNARGPDEDRRTYAPVSQRSAWLAVILGAGLGGLGFVLQRRTGRAVARGTHRAVAVTAVAAVLFAAPVLGPSSAFGSCAALQSQDDVSKLTDKEAQLKDVEARYEAFTSDRITRIVQRLTRDLQLNERQASACEEILNSYADTCQKVTRQLSREMTEWRRQYWLSRYPELHEDADISHLTTEEWLQLQTDRKILRFGARMPREDWASEQARLQASARVRLETTLPAQRDALRTMLEEIASHLDDTQASSWDRASRRLQIAVHDGMNIRGGDISLEVNLDMLSLLEEASDTGEELEALAPVIRDTVGPRERQGQPYDDELLRVIEAFELRYLAALERHERAWEEVWTFRASGHELDDPKGNRVADSYGQTVRELWYARIEFVEALAASARDAGVIGPEQAAAWESRFFARCCPRLFRFDRVDVLARRLIGNDAVPTDMQSYVETVVEQYRADRHRLRLEIAGMIIRKAWLIGDRQRHLDALEQRYDDRDARELQTTEDILGTLAHAAPTVHEGLAPTIRRIGSPPR